MNTLVFRTETGQVVSGNEVVFPLLSQGEEVQYRVVGTGFFILREGIFVTAKHCLAGHDENQLPWLMGLMDHGHMRRVDSVVPHDQYDFAIGFFQRNEYECDACTNHRVLTLTTRTPEQGEELTHFGCEQSRLESIETVGDGFSELRFHLSLHGYRGLYEGFDAGNPLAPWPHHFTNSFFPSGSSGGPTVDTSQMVCGVNSSSSKGYEEVQPHGRLTRVIDLVNSSLSGNALVNGVLLHNPTLGAILSRGGGRIGGD